MAESKKESTEVAKKGSQEVATTEDAAYPEYTFPEDEDGNSMFVGLPFRTSDLVYASFIADPFSYGGKQYDSGYVFIDSDGSKKALSDRAFSDLYTPVSAAKAD